MVSQGLGRSALVTSTASLVAASPSSAGFTAANRRYASTAPMTAASPLPRRPASASRNRQVVQRSGKW